VVAQAGSETLAERAPLQAGGIIIPDVFHTISGEEESTNPWDIPQDKGSSPDGEVKRAPGKD
jgi:hypothetical protein